VIGRVLNRGTRIAGLVRYLYGPEKAEEHRDPHIVASWTGETSSLEPAVTGPGSRDFRSLIGLLEAPLAAQHVWLRPDLRVDHTADDAMTDPVGRTGLVRGFERRYGIRTARDDPGSGRR
jgi:hypothetical protein